MALETTPAQLLEGFTVGIRGTTHCQWCDHEFDEGHVAIVLFTQAVDTDRWDIHRTYCTPCNPSTIARPVLDCPKLLVQCRLGLCADSTTRPTKLVALEPKLIDSSGLAEGSLTIEGDENTDPDASAQPLASNSGGVEIETLPASLSASATHHLETDSSIRSEEQPVPDDSAD